MLARSPHRRHVAGRPHGRRGAQALEFALLLPVLMMVLAGVGDYGWLFFQQHNLVHGVQEGLRAGISAEDDIDPVSFAEDAAEASLLNAGFDASDITVTASLVGGAKPNVLLHVQAQAAFTPFFGFVPVPSTISSDLTGRLIFQR